MLKVTGGGTRVGAVAAHLQYISRKGELTIETSEGDRVTDREAQKTLIKNWHLELICGQYRPTGIHGQKSRRTKLVHNIVLSMPSPTPPDKVLAATRKFAREKFTQGTTYSSGQPTTPSNAIGASRYNNKHDFLLITPAKYNTGWYRL